MIYFIIFLCEVLPKEFTPRALPRLGRLHGTFAARRHWAPHLRLGPGAATPHRPALRSSPSKDLRLERRTLR